MLTTEALYLRAENEPDRVIFVAGDRVLTYRQWYETSSLLAEQLIEQGLKAKQTIALAYRGDSWIDYVVASLAVQLAGALPFGLPEHLSGPSVDSVLSRAGAMYWVGNQSLSAPLKRLFLSLAAPATSSAPAAIRRVSPTVTSSSEIAELVITSGTTGGNKVLACSHEELMRGACTAVTTVEVQQDRRTHLSRPIIGTNAAVRAVNNALRGTWFQFHILSSAAPRELLENLLSRSIDELALVPAAAASLVSTWQGPPFEKVQKVHLGSASTPDWVATRLQDLFPHAEIRINYGLTEAGYFRLSGRVTPGARTKLNEGSLEAISIVDDYDRPCAIEQPGRVKIRIDVRACRSYYDRGHLTPVIGTDGFFETNDLMEFAPGGGAYFLSRSDDVVNVGGLLISLVEVEDFVSERAEIVDCAAFTVPHPSLGECLVMAIVVDESSAPSLVEMKANVSAALGRSAPRAWIEVAGIPRTVTGKVQRKTLFESMRGQLK